MKDTYQNNQKVIVIGAGSGIGRALAKIFASNGYKVGLVDKQIEFLKQVQREISGESYVKQIDVSDPKLAITLLNEFIKEMGGMDLIVISSGVIVHNPNLEWAAEDETISVNVSGFIAMANVAAKYFLLKDSGHLVGISSIGALIGNAKHPAYNASKAFICSYLRSLRYRFSGSNIYVTDIRPGFVDTVMIKNDRGLFWVATPEEAARQIFKAIKKKRKVAYITKRWLVIAWLVKIIPDWVYCLRYKAKL
jgi:short-subunit dehydrogenase